VYNLAYPFLSLLKDLVLIEHVRTYNPDQILWFVTLNAFDRSTEFENDTNLANTFNLLSGVITSNKLKYDVQKLPVANIWEKTIIGQRRRLKNIVLLQIYGFLWGGLQTDLDWYAPQVTDSLPLSNDVEPEISYYGSLSQVPPVDLKKSWTFDVLRAGYWAAGDIPVVVINEPIYIATGANSELRYNSYWPRWVYDEYRSALSDWMAVNQHEYVDAWDILPRSEFIGTPLHRTEEGNRILAEFLVPSISRATCISP
jgi:hypothetical protein